jgi:polysaccharide export outer membrane protein
VAELCVQIGSDRIPECKKNSVNLRCFVKPVLLILLALLLTTCSTTPDKRNFSAPATGSAPTPSDINHALAALANQSPASLSDYKIGPEDLVQITLFNIPESEGRITPRTVSVRVSQQGTVSLPLLGEIHVKGLSVSSIEKLLRERYDKYIYNPLVGVLVVEYRQRVSVIGAVQKSGVFELSGPKTVLDMLAAAGGVTEKAGTQVHIYRQTLESRETYIMDLLVLVSNASSTDTNNAALITMPVQAGDVINVPAAGTFFVDGAVKTPGPYPLGRRYSLTQALATAGGVDRELYSSEITIFRRKRASEIETITVDFDAVMAGAAADPPIEADDVIVVPMSTAKYLVKRFIGQLIAGGISLGSFIPAAGS